MAQLANLQTLSLSSNELTAWPKEMAQLANLQWLFLSSNKLTAWPKEMAQLANLQRLYLSDNQLTAWPVEMAQLKTETYWKIDYSKKGFYLENNPLENPPPEIIQQGQATLLEYFKAGKQQRLNEVKVLLVGDGGAGKTSLVKQLLGEPFNSEESQTKGIAIKQWEVVDISHLETTTEDEQTIKVHLWDFGGQDIMHATHQFFLSKRSLYILVLDGRKQENPEYWLKYIESFGGHSPILVVLNKLDQHPFEVNRKDLQHKYHGIEGFYPLSCDTQEGIKVFQTAFQQALHKIEIRRMFLPITWFEIKTQLEQMAEPYIDYTQYTNLCASANITDKSTQQILINYLCHLGTILHFQESQLKYTHVLEPKWVTQAIYKIINARRVTENKGILEFDDLEIILEPEDEHDYVYPGEQHTYIVGLMKTFELCYPLDEQRVLIPDLLPVEEPDFSFDQTLQVQLHYNFLPKSVMPRFIVRRHRDIKNNLRWRTGVVLSDDKTSQTIAVVKADNEARKIYISVSGPQPRDYFAIVRKTFKDINNSFEKIEVDEQVCLPDYPSVTVNMASLQNMEKHGKTTFEPEELIKQGIFKQYNVQELLGTVVIPGKNRENEEMRRDIKTIKEKIEHPKPSIALGGGIFPFSINNLEQSQLFQQLKTWAKNSFNWTKHSWKRLHHSLSKFRKK